MTRYKDNKVGRNDPCPCGSGTKFKYCHGRPADLPPGPRAPISDQARYVAEAFRRQSERQQAMLNRMGRIHVPAMATIAGIRVVSVFNRVYQIDSRRTPLDFMDDRMGEWFGEGWWNEETSKHPERRHPVAFWYNEIHKHRLELPRDRRGYVSTVLTGIHAAWYNLAWDMWVVAQQGLLSDNLLHRLKVADQFQGVRYELTTMTAFLRAGYALTPEERKEKGVSYPEFLATFPGTAEQISVEAKSRHRPGILGYPGEIENKLHVRADVRRLLHQAIAKARHHPHVAFIDLNLRPFLGPLLEEPAIKEVIALVKRKSEKYSGSGSFPASLLIFTNHPHHYGTIDRPNPDGHWAFLVPPKPLHPFSSADVVTRLATAMKQYGAFPQKWDDINTGPAI